MVNANVFVDGGIGGERRTTDRGEELLRLHSDEPPLLAMRDSQDPAVEDAWLPTIWVSSVDDLRKCWFTDVGLWSLCV